MNRRGAAATRARAAILVASGLAFSLFVSRPIDAAGKHRKKPAKKAKVVAADFDRQLPVLGTRLREFPAGPGGGKALADRGCVFCHSADMVAQQRLTEKQWAAEVTKMVNWGADVPADKKEELVAYLVKNFGVDGALYEPVTTRPVGK